MPTCHTCRDTKECQHCDGEGMVNCRCNNGKCSRCSGHGYIISDGVRNTCSDCSGKGKCRECKGTTRLTCPTCKNDKHCQICYGYRLKWKQASTMAKSGDAYNAVALLTEMIVEFDQRKKSDTNTGRIGGAGAGAAIGTLLLPGIGTVIGAALGGLFGNSAGEGHSKTYATFEAETHYRLGVIHEMVHNPAALHHYMQARLLDPEHAQAADALARLQPQVSVSQHLTALDDDID